MAGFNGSGTYVRSYNWVTDAGNNIDITASRVDTEDDGFATGLSNVICKDGQTTTTVRIPFAVGIGMSDGSAGTPAINFTADTDTGIHRIGTNEIGIDCGGATIIDVGTATTAIAGTVVLHDATASSLALTTPLALAYGGTGDTGSAWATYTATCTASTGTITTATTTAKQKSIGKTQFFQLSCVISNRGSGAADLIIDLPATANTTAVVSAWCVGTKFAVIGVITANSAQVKFLNVSGTTVLTVNDTFIASGVFEKQ